MRKASKASDKRTITYTLIVEQEDTPVRGNALASGDDTIDTECENEILARLDRGDVWAWAFVKVIATLEIEGETFTGTDCLGCCSYASEADFKAPDGYLPQMQDAACVDLKARLTSAVRREEVAAIVLADLA